MSNTAFVESQSSDPFVRELSRRAVRILNDQTLDRRQRENLIRRLQARLQGHQAKQEAKAAQKASKAARRAQIPALKVGQLLADQRQVLSLRNELCPVLTLVPKVPAESVLSEGFVAANDGFNPARRRTVLTLKRA